MTLCSQGAATRSFHLGSVLNAQGVELLGADLTSKGLHVDGALARDTINYAFDPRVASTSFECSPNVGTLGTTPTVPSEN